MTGRQERHAAIATLGEGALSGLDVQDLFDQACRIAADTLCADYAEVLEALPGGEMLRRVGVGGGEICPGITTRIGGAESEAGHAVLSREPIVSEDFHDAAHFAVSARLRAHGVASGVTVALGDPDYAFGTFGVYTARPRSFREDDVHFLKSVVHVLASALFRKRAEEERMSLLGRLFAAQDDERRRIACELHDETGQALAGMLIGLQAVQAATTLAEAKAGVRRLRKIAARAVTDVGRLARGLHPGVLEELGLLAAIRQHAAEHWRSHGLEVRVVASADRPRRRLPRNTELALYRVVQEALTNASMHGRAKHVDVVIRESEAEIELIVRDDGSGFDRHALGESAARGRLGLVGMKERIALLRGRLSIDSRPGAGTTIAARVPRPDAEGP
jgi:signal transduction histidine kinase